jgi:DNA repair exonuclease SbcCD ATPase subunit
VDDENPPDHLTSNYMNPSSATELVEKLKRMVSESHSIAAQLDEYQESIKSKDEEIQLLQTLLDESHAHISKLETRLEEFESLQNKLEELDAFADLPLENPPTPNSPSPVPTSDPSDELIELRRKNTELQARLDDIHSHMLLLKREASTALRYKQLASELQARLTAMEPEKQNS